MDAGEPPVVMTIPPMLDHAPAILVTVCEAVVLLAGSRLDHEAGQDVAGPTGRAERR
jgi:hypothetical protein